MYAVAVMLSLAVSTYNTVVMISRQVLERAAALRLLRVLRATGDSD